jgi:hypothetical protein
MGRFKALDILENFSVILCYFGFIYRANCLIFMRFTVICVDGLLSSVIFVRAGLNYPIRPVNY